MGLRLSYMTRSLALVLAGVLVGGCAAPLAGAARSSADETIPEASPVAATVAAATVDRVSLTADGGLAGEGLAQCNVLAYRSQVAGIGIVTPARAVPPYAAFTGREPEFMTDSPAFVVQFSGAIRLVTLGGPGSAGWVEITNPTCVLIEGRRNWYVTGPWRDSRGQTGTPEAASYDVLDLPQPDP